ncbi:hypothetical protein GCM10010211_43860 [Streptomyces albospinus]|uniref:Sensor protein KdpD transmembrane domain-containing protein n=1 Tax=Streptomyces albospinus TaxID=285515 RepID=A0ABQ2V8F1_9ACTN|nr:DUF4118 domain-containing protein [Streptomyces albospinus]GGU73223.1 hypothetical protein GCM10010211_43860 [Streptomyces albospinus]
MTDFPLRDRIAVGAAVVVPLLIAGVLVPFRGSLSSTSMALIFVVAVVAIAANGSRVAGAVSALSAAAWFDFFLTPPYESFSISRAEDVSTAILLMLVGLAVSQLAARARRLQVVVVTDAAQLRRIHETTEVAQAAPSAEAVVDHVKQELIELLELRACRFEYGTLLGHPPRLEQDGSVTAGRRRWNVDEHGWPPEEIELRAIGNGRYQGRFMLRPSPDARPSLQARLVAVTLADQAGAALDTAGRGTPER